MRVLVSEILPFKSLALSVFSCPLPRFQDFSWIPTCRSTWCFLILLGKPGQELGPQLGSPHALSWLFDKPAWGLPKG